MGQARGRLVVIGGEERRATPEPAVLTRLAFYAGGANGRITVLSPELPPGVRGALTWRRLLRAVGVADVQAVTLKGREAASSPELLARLACSSGLVLVGHDPEQLVALLSGTPVAEAVRAAFGRGACVAGVGAGAAALASHVVGPGTWMPPAEEQADEAGSTLDVHPRAGLVGLSPGLGLFNRLVVDHHFCEKQRLGRLATMAATAPEALGVGVDAGTALVIAPGRGVEVVGRGAVTIFDGSGLSHSSLPTAGPGQTLALCHVGLSLLPAGFSFRWKRGGEGAMADGTAVPPRLEGLMAALASAS
ncbi:MAG: cyanophycinase [Candidatus Sericytochromatia bacterium]|nr:cyanophycinase [Candidatus Sericytochromatia bacterium]